jgi:5-formyltetrahydrofolate cyclo-ligase
MPRSTPRHDRDAGGPADVLAAKAALREEVWSAMRAAKVARFPGAVGRIPNFTGAEAAAERLRGLPSWEAARAVKANPDSAQLPVRQRALEDGKVVYMAVPRLAEREPRTRRSSSLYRTVCYGSGLVGIYSHLWWRRPSHA